MYAVDSNASSATPQALDTKPLLDADCPITVANLQAVRELRQAMLDKGYPPLAVHPPWSPFVGPQGRGKQPLTEVINGEKQSWRRGHSLDRLTRVTRFSANTGLLLGGTAALVALDIDPSKKSPAAEQQHFTLDLLRLLLSDWLRSQLRIALLRLRAPGSALLLLRADRSMTKTVVAGERGKVELLGEGQQFVCHGWHPLSLGGPPVCWTWHNDRSPRTVPVAELPVVSVEDLTALMNRIGASGIFGPPVVRAVNTTTVVRRGRASAYPATSRLDELFRQHNSLVNPRSVS
jgi:hypothetical protein